MANTYAEIQDEIAALQKKAEGLRQAEMNGVIDRIKVAIEHYGITSDQLFDSSALHTKAVTVKFADGNGNVWSGRGPRPRWLTAALSSGVSLEELRHKPGSSPAVLPAPKPRKFHRPPSTLLYADDAGNSWTGRGPMPRWLKEAAGDRSNISRFLKT